MGAIETILVTTDFSDTSKRAFDVALKLATKFNARLILLHVQDQHFPPYISEYGGVALPKIEWEQKARASRTLDTLALQFGPDTVTEIVSGVPHVAIVEMARERKVDLIVMATHGRGFLSHAILGSTTERVVRRAPCPVLSVPDTDAPPE